MVYVVWLPGDDADQFDWFRVFGKKRPAMEFAKEQAGDNKKVVYLSERSDKVYCDYDATKFIVVQQAYSHYHGA